MPTTERVVDAPSASGRGQRGSLEGSEGAEVWRVIMRCAVCDVLTLTEAAASRAATVLAGEHGECWARETNNVLLHWHGYGRSLVIILQRQRPHVFLHRLHQRMSRAFGFPAAPVESVATPQVARG